MSDQNQDLSGARNQIDAIDAGILKLLDERMQLAVQIGKLKNQSGKKVFDPEREKFLLANLVKMNQNTTIPDEKLLAIWGKILDLSRDLQGGDS